MRVVFHSGPGVVALLATGAIQPQQQKLQQAPRVARPTEKLEIYPTPFSWNEMLQHQASLPVLRGVIPVPPEITVETPPIQVSLDSDHVQRRATSAGDSAQLTPLPCAGFTSEPSIGAGFDSQLDVADTNGFSFIPPDVAGAVGPNHLMTMLGNKVLIQDRLGATVTSVDTSTFWTLLGTTPLAPTTTYQRVHFDALAGRWFATAREGTLAALNTRIFFAISQTDDPTGTWDFYSIVADTQVVPTQAADWVVSGYNTTWITITANMLNSAGTVNNGAKMWTVDKSTALVFGGPITVSVFPTGFMATAHGSGGSSVMPARTLDADPTLWMVNVGFVHGTAPTRNWLLQISQITGTGAAPVVSGLAGSPFGGTTSFCTAGTTSSATQRTMAQLAPEVRFITPFSTRMASVAVRNGQIWTANSAGQPGLVDNAAPTSNGIVWHRIDPTLPFPPAVIPPSTAGSMVVDSGAITNGVNTMSMYPSIAVNCANDVLIGFANGDSTRYPRACYTMRLGTDAPGFMGPIQELKAGETNYWKNFGVGTTAQYGRYTSTAVDPNDDRTLWTLQEFADTRVGVADNDSRWGTWWGRLGPCENLPAPSISDDPDSIAVCVGAPASFSVTAAPASVEYQWRRNGVDIPGANSSSYAIGSTVAGDGGVYDVVVSGCGQELSLPATLSFTGAIVNTHPVDFYASPGDPAGFFIVATGTGPITYQWYLNGNPISGATSDLYLIGSVSGADYGVYHCVATDQCGPGSSLTARLLPPIEGGKTQPAELSLHIFAGPVSTIGCLGDPATFSVTAYPAGVSYVWRRNGFPIIPPETGPTLTINPVTPGDAAVYDVQVSLGSEMKTSVPASLTVSDDPLINTQPGPANQSVGPGSTVTYSVVATGLNLKYQWRFRPTASTSFSDMDGMTGSTLILQGVTPADSGAYRCVVSNDCGQVQSSQARLQVL